MVLRHNPRGMFAARQVLGVVLFNISLRMLHTKKQTALSRPLVTGLQYVLRETPVGALFFDSVAKVRTVTLNEEHWYMIACLHVSLKMVRSF